jgi:hypothetical protein
MFELHAAAHPLFRGEAAGRCHGLTFVGDSEALSSLGTPPFQNVAAILRRHPNPEPMGLPPTSGVRLKRALPLHALLRRPARANGKLQ